MSLATTMAAAEHRAGGRPRADEDPDLIARNARIAVLWKRHVPVPTIARIEDVSERTVYRVLAEMRRRGSPGRGTDG